MIKFVVLSLMISLVTSASHARPLDKDRGGGNSAYGQLFDFYENQGTDGYSYQNDRVFRSILAPLFSDLEARLPGLKAYLMKPLADKKWYLESKPLEESGCVNSSLIKVDKQVIACQTQFEVRMSKAWVQQMSQQDPIQVAGLVLHEILTAKLLESPKYISGESVRYLNRLLLISSLPGDSELRDILRERGFGHYYTAYEIQSADNELQKKKSEARAICEGKVRVQHKLIYDFLMRLEKETRDERKPELVTYYLMRFIESLRGSLNSAAFSENVDCSLVLRVL